MRYRKKPVVIEAFQYDGDLMNRNGEYYVPQWAVEAFENGILFFDGPTLKVKTLEGEMVADVNDCIIKGVKGELYPCKPDIFEATYEKTDESEKIELTISLDGKELGKVVVDAINKLQKERLNEVRIAV
ncbi:MAG: hypothetical protein ACLRLE_10480 [Turicibacter sp.]